MTIKKSVGSFISPKSGNHVMVFQKDGESATAAKIRVSAKHGATIGSVRNA